MSWEIYEKRFHVPREAGHTGYADQAYVETPNTDMSLLSTRFTAAELRAAEHAADVLSRGSTVGRRGVLG
jgi:hypothetical protein